MSPEAAKRAARELQSAFCELVIEELPDLAAQVALIDAYAAEILAMQQRIHLHRDLAQAEAERRTLPQSQPN